MDFFNNPITALFAWDLFTRIANGKSLTNLQFNTFTTILTNNNIPFETSFKAGTRREAPSIQLTININPKTTLVFDIEIKL